MRAGNAWLRLSGMDASGRWAGVGVVVAVVAVVVVWDPFGGVVRWAAGVLPDPPWFNGLPQPLAFLLGPGKLLLLVAVLVLADALRRRRGTR